MSHRTAAYVLYSIGAIILVTGLSSAACIYWAAERQTTSAAVPYELNPEYSKQYSRELELYGGQANVLAYEFREWFVGLWRGKSLGYIVGGSAVLVSVGLFFAAGRLRYAHRD